MVQNSPRSPTARAAEYIKAGHLLQQRTLTFRAAVLLDEYRRVDAASVLSCQRRRRLGKAGRDLGFVTLDPECSDWRKRFRSDDAVTGTMRRSLVVLVDCCWLDVAFGTRVLELL